MSTIQDTTTTNSNNNIPNIDLSMVDKTPFGSFGPLSPLDTIQYDHEPQPLTHVQFVADTNNPPLTKTNTKSSFGSNLSEEDDQFRGRSGSQDQKSSSRRSSLAAFTDRLRSRSRSRSVDPQGRNSTSSRRSSNSSESAHGRYAYVVESQNAYMEQLRKDQAEKGITHNADGIPIPPPLQRRRSSVTQILGLDKPLLAF